MVIFFASFPSPILPPARHQIAHNYTHNQPQSQAPIATITLALNPNLHHVAMGLYGPNCGSNLPLTKFTSSLPLFGRYVFQTAATKLSPQYLPH